MLLSCWLGHRWISPFQGSIRLWRLTAMVSRQDQWFIPRAMPHAFPLTNPRHTLLLCTIPLACLTYKPLFFKQSFTVSIHLFRSLPTEWLPAHSILSLSILSTWPNHWRTPSIFSSTTFVTPHNSLPSSPSPFPPRGHDTSLSHTTIDSKTLTLTSLYSNTGSTINIHTLDPIQQFTTHIIHSQYLQQRLPIDPIISLLQIRITRICSQVFSPLLSYLSAFRVKIWSTHHFPALKPPCSSSIQPSVTLRTLSTRIPAYMFPTTLNKL